MGDVGQSQTLFGGQGKTSNKAFQSDCVDVLTQTKQRHFFKVTYN